MPDKKFDLGDYVEVKDRIRVFYELYGNGRLVTERVDLTREPDDKPKVIVYAKAYRSPDDPHPGDGTSWMYLPGTTSYTKGSELENTETSAWGRAIGSLGILIDRSIASSQEVQNKNGTEPVEKGAPVEHNGIGGLVGTVEKGKPPVDMEVRYTKDDGAAWGFALKDGRTKFQVVAKGQLAEDLADLEIPEGTLVTVWGPLEAVPWDKKMPDGSFKTLYYNRINLERITGPKFDVADSPLPVEAESVPLFELDDDEKAAIAAGAPG